MSCLNLGNLLNEFKFEIIFVKIFKMINLKKKLCLDFDKIGLSKDLPFFNGFFPSNPI